MMRATPYLVFTDLRGEQGGATVRNKLRNAVFQKVFRVSVIGSAIGFTVADKSASIALRTVLWFRWSLGSAGQG
jgi:hypothetical protein